ncbi:hypothetical protein EHQ59_03405 [Leptospira kemamanensis]|uniref:Uncharacterized protein n=1 Tax=Leptospira kemamanensis TaxID=2484942 RepID=A0A4R9JS27_9LEPT|nr:hypothetical protein [Leptospira kemamanensis]TGL55472.1 hypothetical protein EHQ59_03405 [Leptospira kemamanensis]
MIKYQEILVCFVFSLLTVANCSTEKKSDDLTQLFLLNALNSSRTTATACGYLLTSGSTIAAGKFEVNRTLRTIDTWESTKSGSTESQRVLLIFTGVSSTDRIRFVYSGTDLNDFSPGRTKSTSTTCPFQASTMVDGFNTLGLTRDNSVSNRWLYNASGTTPSQFSMLVSRDDLDDLSRTLSVIIESQ